MSKIQVNEVVNHFDNGAPDFPRGVTVTGVSTFSGAVSVGGTSKIQVNEVVNHLDNGAPDFPRGVTVTGVSTFSGDVSIGGTLTYEDVTSIDSVGVITARNGLDVSGITTVTGAVSVNGNNYPSSGFFSYRNLVINGAMEVAQRGTSGSSNGAYNCVDRIFRHTSGVTGPVTDSQQALTSGDPYDEGFRSFFRVATIDPSTVAVHSYLTVKYKFEAGDIARSGWKYTDPNSYVTLSFWVRANVTQDYGFSFQTHDGTSYLYNKKFSLVAGTWKKITQKVPGNANISFDNDTGHGMTIDWYPFLGGTFNNATDDSWAVASTNKFADNIGTSWWTSADATFDITGVQLEVGDVATPFERRPYSEELIRCDRYYQRYNVNFNNQRMALAGNGSLGQSYPYIWFRTPMRDTPSFEYSAVGHFKTETFSNSTATVTALTVSERDISGAVISTATGGSSGNVGANLLGIAGGTGYIAFSAEL